MNVERQRSIFVEWWSDSRRIVLRRNNRFLHSFHDFSNSNAFSENFIRTKFILHKIVFRLSTLSNNKTSLIFFNSDAIQQKVYKVGKLVFPNAVKIGRGDCKVHFKIKLNQLIHVKSSYDILNL